VKVKTFAMPPESESLMYPNICNLFKTLFVIWTNTLSPSAQYRFRMYIPWMENSWLQIPIFVSIRYW